MELIRELESFRPWNEQEEKDQKRILQYMRENDDVFLRQNETAHVTASAWVVNSDRSKVLMAYHKIYDSWAWLGGHADGNTDLRAVAVKEVQEESGLKTVRFVIPEIFSVEVLTVEGHEKRGAYVSSHLHLNVTYLLEGDESEPLQIKEDENVGVAWFPLEEVYTRSTEPWFIERIYKKLNRKLIELSQ